ncbi:MAG: septum formation protein Maf [Candidatus Hydrogenedens sp.]|nr:septum formation protein Maf [Candidatus Hydrogenedens sp.]
MRRIVLASGSPRRRALLDSLGLQFGVITSDAEETNHGESPALIVERNAALKRDDVAARLEGDALVIAADTLVFEGPRVLAKPPNRAEAIAMLEHLSGRTHQVCTGLAVCDTATGRAVQGTETTDVTFRELTRAEIERFVDVVNPLDRAGAYTVDGPGMLLVARYGGCYQNVLGLPVARLDALLRQLDFHLFDALDKERAVFL